MRRRRTPEGEYAASLRIARAMSEESRQRFVDLCLTSAAGYDELAALERKARADLDGDLYADVYVAPGRKRSVARRANADAKRATIHRAEALGYGMQYGPVEPAGVRR